MNNGVMPYIQLTIPVVPALAVFYEKIMIFKIETNPIGEKIIVLNLSQSSQCHQSPQHILPVLPLWPIEVRVRTINPAA